MRRPAVALVVAAAVAAGLTVSPASAAADDARVEAFFAACLTGFRVPAERAAAVQAAGFRPAPDDAHPVLEALLKLSRAEMVEMQKEKFGVSLAVYDRGTGADALYLVTNEADQPPDNKDFRIDLMGCELYDFAATAPLDPAPMTGRLGQPPARTLKQPGGGRTHEWAAGIREGLWEITSSFSAKGSPQAVMTGFSGVLLSVTSTKAD